MTDRREAQTRQLIKQYESACQGKVRRRRGAAQREAQRLNNRHRDKQISAVVAAYHCPHCRAWHVGRQKAVQK